MPANTMQIDGLVAIATLVIPDADTAVEAVLPIPDLPVFPGLRSSCQSLTIPIGAEHRAHFTHGTMHTILR